MERNGHWKTHRPTGAGNLEWPAQDILVTDAFHSNQDTLDHEVVGDEGGGGGDNIETNSIEYPRTFSQFIH